MTQKRYLQTWAAFSMGVFLILFLAACSQSPTAPDYSDIQITQDAANSTSNAPSLAAVTSLGYDQGVLPSGGLYEIYVPDSWNNDVVIYAHGYVHPQDPLALPNDVIEGTPVYQIITSMGYAFASTSYRRNGLVIPDGVNDLMELVDVFKSQHPSVNHVLLAGVSEGGLITTLACEKHPDVFDGGFTGCGPIGDFKRQLNYFGDFRVVFDYLFPGVIPGSAVDIPQSVIDNWETVYKPLVIGAISAFPHKTEQLLRVTGAAFDPSNPLTVGNTVTSVLEYNIFGTNDAIEQLGGQPYDNFGKIYHGSDNDLLLNRQIARFHADQAALRELAANYQTSGQLTVPLSSIHTTKDEVIPFWQEQLYSFKTLRGHSQIYFSNIPVDRYGHCNFTQAEVLAAFSVLILKVSASDLLVAESTIPSSQEQTQLLTISKEFGAKPRIIPNDQLK